MLVKLWFFLSYLHPPLLLQVVFAFGNVTSKILPNINLNMMPLLIITIHQLQQSLCGVFTSCPVPFCHQILLYPLTKFTVCQLWGMKEVHTADILGPNFAHF